MIPLILISKSHINCPLRINKGNTEVPLEVVEIKVMITKFVSFFIILTKTSSSGGQLCLKSGQKMHKL